MTTTTRKNHPIETTPNGVRGIIQTTVPVSDLARSAAFYRDLLGMTYIREFGDDDQVTGCALADWDARYLIALRRRDSLAAGEADLRGEHPIIVEAESPDAAERLRARATALGIPSTSGAHADGTWIEFLDPDGIAIRVVHSTTATDTFFGVAFGANGEPTFYNTPRLTLPAQPHDQALRNSR
jgi:catechol 2,3-dioxygenase-like lactoylglutathione lyase family enzyme